VCVRVRFHVCVCLKRNIFLYYYSHRAYFSYPPTCIPGGWVCSFSLSVSLSLSLSLYTSSSLLLGTTRKIPPRTCGALFLFYARIATRNCVARPAARKKRGNGAHLLSTLLLFLLPCLCFPFLSLSTIERRLLLQL